jgi:hypothetical protein
VARIRELGDRGRDVGQLDGPGSLARVARQAARALGAARDLPRQGQVTSEHAASRVVTLPYAGDRERVPLASAHPRSGPLAGAQALVSDAPASPLHGKQQRRKPAPER